MEFQTTFRMESILQNQRQRLIEHLQYRLAQLYDEKVPFEEIERSLCRYQRVNGIHRHLSEVESQIKALRDEIQERSRKPVRCLYSEDQSHNIQLLTGISGSSDHDKKYIKKKSYSNNWMIITDPYFLQWDGPNKAFKTEKAYTEFIIDFIPRELKKLELFILPGPNKRIFKKFNDRISSRGTSVSYWQTTEIHDRTIIRDNYTATLMGTSFGGYSNKLSFVLDIPDKDLKKFMSELVRIRNAK